MEQFGEAVVLSAQTALRNAIGKHDLAVLLSERDRLGQEIQKTLDEKTSAWGITTQAVEIRDIIIPKGLEDAMSRQAQAERERQSRIILGTAETEIAEKFARASEHYRDNPVALHLRAMNMLFEGLQTEGGADHRSLQRGGDDGTRCARRLDGLRPADPRRTQAGATAR